MGDYLMQTPGSIETVWYNITDDTLHVWSAYQVLSFDEMKPECKYLWIGFL